MTLENVYQIQVSSTHSYRISYTEDSIRNLVIPKDINTGRFALLSVALDPDELGS